MMSTRLPWTRTSLGCRSLATLALAFTLLLAATSGARAETSDEQKVAFFEQNIRPTLINNCLECHGRQKAENGLRLGARETLMRGGDNGKVIEPGKPEASRLITAISYEHDDLQMPPDGKLDDHVIANFEKWVADGAVWPESLDLPEEGISLEEGRKHWAYQPIRDPDVPDVEGAATPIDAFILKQMQEEGLQPVGKADRRTLIRRASYDLTGLPPTPEEVEAFVNDESPDAYARLIDRLLASPEYGRRWGRHWMDVARYADTSGAGEDRPVQEAQLYRDYIIDAFNDDLPFDDFVIEQIAGDILAEQNPEERYEERIIATTFISISRRFGQRKFEYFPQVIENTLDTIGRGLLAQTLTCARCHDHKFDPIPEDDYYAMYGFFKSTQYAHPGSEEGRDRDFFVPLEPEQAEQLAAWEAEAEPKLEAIEKEFESHPLIEEIKQLEVQIAAIRSELEAVPAREERLEPKIDALRNERRQKRREHRQLVEEAKSEILAERPREPRVAYGVTDKKDPNQIGNARIHIGGDENNLGDEAPRGFLSVITPERPDIPEGESGRLQLAQWLVSDENPLTPRVMANRIWHWHFGRGIVPSTDDFGVKGDEPTHPELLDYLASRLLESGWSFKEMHRQIMLSDAYQRQSVAESSNLAVDPTNRLLWRFDRRRLEAEAIRDAVLFVSGELDFARGPDHPFGTLEQQKRYTQHVPFLDVYPHNHRSVYLMTQRFQKHPFLGLFDGPNRNKTTGVRSVSTVPLQALYIRNSDFIQENSEALADRLLAMDASDQDRMTRLFEMAFARPPSEEELERSLAFIEHAQQSLNDVPSDERHHRAWTSFARVVFGSSEFIYID